MRGMPGAGVAGSFVRIQPMRSSIMLSRCSGDAVANLALNSMSLSNSASRGSQ